MKRWIPLFLLLFLAAVLRFYKIGVVPHGLAFDEAAISYNAWSIALWHRDEFAAFMPLAFKSFGDYKPPLLIYVLSIPYLLFGLHPEWIRWISALAGLGTVGLTYAIGLILIKKYDWAEKLHTTIHLPFVMGLFVAISPWAIHFSRLGFEQNIALFFITLGMWCLLKAETQPFYWRYAAAIFALSLYTFHTSKVFVLVFGILYTFRSFGRLKRYPKEAVFSGMIFFLLTGPLIYTSIGGNALLRANTLIWFTEHGTRDTLLNVGISFATNLAAYLDPRFWIQGYDAIGLRHAVPGFGVMYYGTFLFFLIGLGFILRQRYGWRWLLAWITAGFLPSIISHTTPHALRSLFAVVPIEIVAAIGIGVLVSKTSKVVMGMLLALIALQMGLYLKTYYGQYRIDSAPAFQYGYREALLTIKEHPDIKTIVVGDSYEQPYIYILLYNQIPPESFLFGALAPYQFRSISWPENTTRTLYIATPAEIPITDPRVVDTIMIPDSTTPILVIAKT